MEMPGHIIGSDLGWNPRMFCHSELASQTFEKVIKLLFLLTSSPEKVVNSSSIPLMQYGLINMCIGEPICR